MFLLVREADVGTMFVVCPASDQQPFVNYTDYYVADLWDFGANPTDHQSYSYHFPYGKFPADPTGAPGNAVMADRNPWFDKKLTASAIKNESRRTYSDKVSLLDMFKGARSWKTRIGNSYPHGRKGQLVLFNDGHVDFSRRPDVGTKDDNIYTIGGETEVEKRIGTPPTSEEIDAFDEEDSLLVNDRL